jgi:CrcB protein
MKPVVQVGLVALGSALGGVARWGVGLASARLLGTAFPYGTFLINVSGSFFLGWFLTVLGERSGWAVASWFHPDELRLAVAVGFTGAYTTFSTFEWESHGLLRDGDGLAATAYILGSVLLGLVAVRIGAIVARYI